jgi:hypothetical protein
MRTVNRQWLLQRRRAGTAHPATPLRGIHRIGRGADWPHPRADLASDPLMPLTSAGCLV